MTESLKLTKEQQKSLQTIRRKMKKLSDIQSKVNDLRKEVEGDICFLSQELLPEGIEPLDVVDAMRISSDLDLETGITNDYSDCMDYGNPVPSFKEFKSDYVHIVMAVKENQTIKSCRYDRK